WIGSYHHSASRARSIGRWRTRRSGRVRGLHDEPMVLTFALVAAPPIGVARVVLTPAIVIAGLSGFPSFSQLRQRADRQGALSRFDTMPSRPILEACRKIRGAVLVGVCAENDSDTSAAQEPRQERLAIAQRQSTEIHTIQLEQVETVEHGLADGAVPVKCVKHSDSIRSTDAGLAIDCE